MQYYLRFAIFSIGMMFGIHMPAMTNHYQQTVQSNLELLEPQVAKLQRTANADFYGSIDSLAEFYSKSSNEKIAATGARVRTIKNQYDALQTEAKLFSDNFVISLFDHALNDHQQTFRGLTNDYHWQPRLTPTAIATGLVLALLLCFIFELFKLMLSGLTRSKAGKSSTATRPRRRKNPGRHF